MFAKATPSVVFGLTLILAAAAFAADAEPAADQVAGLVRGIKVLPDKAPDCSSLKSIVESVTRDCKTNDEKAIALYNFMRLTHYHRAYPSEPGGIPVLKEIHCYGWSLCGGLHAEQSALWREMGWDWRFVGWPGHTTVEAFYDGRWHYLDVFLKFYAWMPDPDHPGGQTIAGQDDLAANPEELVRDAFVLDKSRKVMYARGNEFKLIGEKANWQAPAFLVCGDDIPGIIDGVRHKNRVGAEPGWAGMRHATGNYSADVNLSAGCALTNTWDKADGAWYWAGSKIAPCHTCGDKEIRNSPEKGPIAEPYLGADWPCESYANGQIVFCPDLSSGDCLRSFAAVENVKLAGDGLMPAEPGKPARVTVLLQSPYILTQASGSADGVEQLEVSRDGGRTWKAADLKDFGAAVGGQIKVLLRLTLKDRLQNLRLQATVQNNPFALPYLSPGKNTITVSVADPASLGENKLVVTYAYRTGSRRKSYEQLCREGKEIARGHDASWDTTPTVVQKVFTARDLPAKFEIDVPTPQRLHPVYPRMLFVRREVLAPNQQPLPLPNDARPPTLNSGDELKTLRNPLLSGTEPPPPRIVRPVKTVALASPDSVTAADARAPTEVIRPFEQQDLGSFTSWLKKTGSEDPQGVFRLENGILRCGDEDMGYVATKEAYKDYHLSVEYRWGRKNPHDKYVRNSGVLLNGVGPDGSNGGVWMTSIECQLAQGCEGDLIVIKGKTAAGKPYPATIASMTTVAQDGKTRWDKDGKPTVYSGKQFWWSKHQPYFKELIDTRGQNDLASPLGEWTKVECLCKGSRITIKIGGVTVNECFDTNPGAGKILLQSEGHEVFFRNLELRPLPTELKDGPS